ncbi:hypothetical protein DCS_03514 [Drechmeria coniospora]|uniref:Uncharacterized protein n=1 Tax=Drechmeria coniospora TaxID=98403 RepID=A0A151GHE2_DRECN|nr:hypothetical protein DCS_03514 [Drechmeria coniospora]KYK56514.1 hypothetical protein DCS_03514 [Drechmeria coniospora]
MARPAEEDDDYAAEEDDDYAAEEDDDYPPDWVKEEPGSRWYRDIKKLWNELGPRLTEDDRKHWIKLVRKMQKSRKTTPSHHPITVYARNTGSWLPWLFLRTMFGYDRVCSLKAANVTRAAYPGVDLHSDWLPEGYPNHEWLGPTPTDPPNWKASSVDSEAGSAAEAERGSARAPTRKGRKRRADPEAVEMETGPRKRTRQATTDACSACGGGLGALMQECLEIKKSVLRMEAFRWNIEKQMEEMMGQQRQLYNLMRSQFEVYLDAMTE